MKRYRETETGYKFDKLLFIGVFLIFMGIVFYTMLVNKFDFSTHPYFECHDVICKNPFYSMTECKQQISILFVIPLYKTEDCKLTCEWCNQEYLSSGIYGEKPKAGFLLNYMWLIGLILIGIGLALNHFIHNKNKPFDIEIVFTEKKKLNLRKLIEGKYEKLKDN